MNLFYGRVDRKTYLIGMGLVLVTTVTLAFLFILPLAAFELAVPALRDGGPGFLDRLVLIVPVIFLVVSSFSLMIRRAHDLASDGFLWLIALFAALIARILLDSGLSSILPLIVIAALASIPGTPGNNRYGHKPNKKFKLENTYNLKKAKHML